MAEPWENAPIVGGDEPWANAPIVKEAQQGPEKTGFFEGLGNAAATMFNDINAGFQGVNPVGMEQTRGQAVGTLRNVGDKQYVDVDGVLEPLDRYPADRFATHLDRESGLTLIIPRQGKTQDGAPYDNNDPRLASAGRLAGYGAVLQTGKEAVRAGSEVAQAAKDLDVVPSFAMRGPAQARIAATGQQFFPTAGAFGNDAARVADELGQAGQRIAQNAGPGSTAVEAGSALIDGSNVFVKNFRDKSKALYNAVDPHIPAGTVVTSRKTVELLDDLTGIIEEAPNIAKDLGANKLRGWMEDLASGVSWKTARHLRSEIGQAVGKMKGPMGDMADGQLKQIYAALSTDLDEIAQKSGPDAVRAWSRANKYHAAGRTRIDEALDKMLKADSPERAFSNFMGMAKRGAAQSNIFKIKKTIQSLPKDDRAVVAGTIIRQMGEATPGAQSAAGDVFSPSTFLTNWNRMDPEARNVIAGAGMDPGVKGQLNRLAALVERAKDAKAFENHSNSGGVVANAVMAFLAGGGFSGPVIGGAGAGYLTAKALTSRKFLEGLNDAAATGRTGKLQAIAEGGGPLAVEAETILRLAAQTSVQSSPAAPSP